MIFIYFLYDYIFLINDLCFVLMLQVLFKVGTLRCLTSLKFGRLSASLLSNRS